LNQINNFEEIYLQFIGFGFLDVKFDFYLNNTFITKDLCVRKNFPSKTMEYFWPMKWITFTQNVFCSQSVCPYVFLNSRLERISFYEITKSLIYKNQLEFIEIENDTTRIGINEDLSIKRLESISILVWSLKT